MRLHLLLYFIFVSTLLFSQENRGVIPEKELALNYKYYGDSTVLRWGFTNPITWYKYKNSKAEIWRRDISRKGNYEKIAEVVAEDSIQMEKTASSLLHPEMALVVLENMYRNWENTYFTDLSTMVEKSDNLHNRWSLVHLASDLDKDAARVAGLRFVDKNVKPNTSYAYKIVVDNQVDYKVAIPVKKSFKPVIFQFEEGESKITITWDKKLHDYQYTAYFVEVSEDGKFYTQNNDAPLVQMFDREDEGQHMYYNYNIQVENYKSKWIRLIGLDPFGEKSEPSEPIHCMGRDKTPPKAAIVYIDSTISHLTKSLSWTIENEADVQICHLERSFKDKVILIKDINKQRRNVYVDSLSEEGIYKYRLITVDTAGNESFSTPVYTKVFDLIPPAKPTGLKAITDTSGIIIITWDPAIEGDVIGYNIYAADEKLRSFVKLNAQTHKERIFIDSTDLYLLTRDRHYFIIAVDNDFLRSAPSDTIRVSRPDIIPPSPALLADYHVKKEGISLTIFPSSSRDIAYHELWRMEEGKAWEVIQTFTKIPKSYFDKNVVPKTHYFYKVHAVDFSGNRSVSVKDIKLSSMQNMPEKPYLFYSLQKDTIEMTIDVKLVEDQELLIYKGDLGKKLTFFKSVSESQFKDLISTKKPCHYKVRIRYKNGSLGPFSNEIQFQ